MKTNFNMGEKRPIAFIAKNKQRLKQYGDTVYLKNGDEFQLELYNPTSKKVLAKIFLNNESIGNGIVLRPGERVFLDRYVSEAKKFLFETYKVNGNNDDVKEAIENNGDVKVQFYNEQQENGCYYSGNITISDNWWNTPYYSNIFTTSNCYSGLPSTVKGFNNSSYTTSISCDTLGFLNQSENISTKRSKEIETGRVEKGSHSNQKMKADYSNFENYCISTSEWKILPESRKIINIDDMVIYCSSCGRKRRNDKENYCPSCGNKF